MKNKKIKGLNARINNQDGFVLVYAIMMIALLMIIMSSLVMILGYTNSATNEKLESQQLQLSAQSAITTLEEEFSKPENIDKLLQYASNNAIQDYDLSEAGINDKITAKLTMSGTTGYALLTVVAKGQDGSEYETSTLIPMSSISGTKNDLINNMIVSYWPSDRSRGLISGSKSFAQIVMNGAVIIDNEYCEGKYGIKDTFQKFITNKGGDPTSVKIKGGKFKELITTGNLQLNAEMPITGIDGATIASAMGQLIITRGVIGDGTNGITEIGAGGYFVDKATSTKKTGGMLIGTVDGIQFKDAINVLSRDSVAVTASKITGVLNNCFIGGKFILTGSSNGDLEILGDIQGYKDVEISVAGREIGVGGDVAAGNNLTVKGTSNGELDVAGSLVTASGNITISGNSSTDIEADSILAGKSITSSGVDVELSGNTKGYTVFAGGNYKDTYLNSVKKRGAISLSNVESENGKKGVNNTGDGKTRASGITLLSKESSVSNTNAFKTMNSYWLSKAQKVYKGGRWGNPASNVNFAVALLFDNTFANANSHLTNENKKTSAFMSNSNNYFDPNKTDNTDADYAKNWFYYEHAVDKYHNGSRTVATPVSAAHYYTTNDNVFLLRTTLRAALGGPSSSVNLKLGASNQGRFIDKARSAIPKDGAINEITVNYPTFAGYGGVTVDQSDYAQIESYKDGYLIGGATNFGKIAFSNDGRKIYDGSSYYDVSGRTLYFKCTDPSHPGGYGDFYITSQDNTKIDINNKIVIEYQLDGVEPEDIEKLSFIRFFVDPSRKITFTQSSSIVGSNTYVDTHDIDFVYNEFHYTDIMPEVYFFCEYPRVVSRVNIEIDTKDINAFIISPWSYVDMETASAGVDNQVFRGIILCNDLIIPQSGIFNHYKPITFGRGMDDNVFTVPDAE